ncbi:MAG: hypothetical protein ABIL70_00310 [candidate division WOR-3 bacterium]
MRIIGIFLLIVIYLFLLVYIESELVKIEIKKEPLKKRLIELKNEKKDLSAKLIDLSNLAVIEAEAKKRDFVFPTKEDILGVVK